MKFNREFANQIIDDLINCVDTASKEIMQIYNSDNFETSDKADGSPLTLACLLYTSPSPRDLDLSRMPSSA